MLVYSHYGAVASAIFRIITELGVFVVQWLKREMLVSGGGNASSEASTRAVQTAAVARVAVTGGV